MRKRAHSQQEPPAEITTKEQKEQVTTLTREYTLLTPLFGGGVEPTEYDPVTIVRATEIRGYLRFWWRACRGGDYKTLQELKAAEDAIWGKAHKKGDKDNLKYYQTVQIVVELPVYEVEEIRPFRISQAKDKKGNLRYTAPYDKSTDVPAYIAFPLQPTEQELAKNRPPKGPAPDSRPVYENIRFNLMLTFPEKYSNDIKAAIWAWESFGGIGARTRRGFGALKLLNQSKGDNSQKEESGAKKDSFFDEPFPMSSETSIVDDWLRARLEDKEYVSSGNAPDGVLHLSRKTRFYKVSTNDKAKEAWANLVAKLADFRQSRERRAGRGGSHWPEANAIRYILKDRKNKPLLKFPRAAFGLPIVFHFLKEPIDDQVPTLQGTNKKAERLASPLILCLLYCGDGKTVGLALLLDGYRLPPGNIVIKEKDTASGIKGQQHKVDVALTKGDLAQLPNLKLNGKTDILQAFMDYVDLERQK
jgi:CRISPR-associated protein Cmr1